MNRIFEPFFTTKEIGRGTGLGLATAYAVVTQLRGHINVFSEPGCGTTFKIYLPYQISDVPAAQPIMPAPEATEASIEQETILLVEDEDAVRRSVRRVLEHQGYAVIEAKSGGAGLAVAAAFEGTIDMLVTDIMMPGMNGRAFADALLIARPQVSVVFMSGYTDDSISQNGLVDATHAFLQKPFTGKQLKAALHSLRRTTAMAEA
jgi:CheY-like chemotaxis protein